MGVWHTANENEEENDIERGKGRIWSEMEWNLKEGRGIMEMDKFSQSRSRR